MTAHHRDDTGQAGGWEVIPFGILIFVIGTLFIVNVWAVVDARLVVGDAARDGARAFVHADNEAAARHAANQAVRTSVTGRGHDDRIVTIDRASLEPRFERCATVTVRVHETVPAIVLPIIGGFGHGFRVTGSQREIIDPFRPDLPPTASCNG